MVLLLLSGCRPKTASPLPTYPLLSEQQSLAAIAERNHRVQTVSSTCAITLTRADGQSVVLDGILLSAPPDKLRLQSSKFGQKLFDLTLNADGLFVRVDDPSRKDKLIPASENAGRFAREWALFTGGFFDATDLATREIASTQSGGPAMLATRVLPDGRRVTCEIDRATLVPKVYQMYDPSGTVRFTLTIPEYRLVSLAPAPAKTTEPVPYPDRMIAKSEQGTIEIQMREIELNTELPDGAFVPPANAQRVK